jgi:hypothetical protein
LFILRKRAAAPILPLAGTAWTVHAPICGADEIDREF